MVHPVKRPLLWAVAFHVVAIGVWIVLRTSWFDGSVGCDDEGGAAYDRCTRRSDAIAYYAWIEAALLALTLAGLAFALLLRPRRPGR